MRRLAFVAPGLVAATLGCFTGEALEGEPCVVDGDCGPSFACNDGLCGQLHCTGGLTITLDNFAPDVMLLVDYAQTMNKPSGEGTRWDLAFAAVRRISEETGARLNLGVQQVPTVVTDPKYRPCATSVTGQLPPAAGQGGDVLAALPVETPTLGEHALRRGLEYSLAALDARVGTAYRARAVVLISDGPFNCSALAADDVESVTLFDADLAAAAAAAAAAGVGVYVVGVDVTATGGGAPGAGKLYEDVDKDLAFRELALAGGRPRDGEVPYYTPDTLDELLDELAALPEAFPDCKISLEAKPTYAERVVIAIGDVNHKRRDTCEGGHGWRWSDASQKVVELCSDTCEDFRAQRSLTVDLRCPAA